MKEKLNKTKKIASVQTAYLPLWLVRVYFTLTTIDIDTVAKRKKN